ncbi:MAG: LON peptidase substrate-binding domain-containing protein [Phycisphaerae bacterium]|nr:LON peptidase substrate-binding domain-containing protein [Phycisphaerae bacterium]
MGDEPIHVPSVIPLFPLPGIVLFPHTILPLHIFEPRYREMMTDALSGARVLGTALLKPGFEPLYYTPRAPIHTTIGVGQIVEWEQVEDGNYNLLLRGIGRAVILEEVPDQAYRQARVEPLETYCSRGEAPSKRLRGKLFGAIRENPALDRILRKNWLRLRDAPLDLGELADLLAAGLPAEPELRQCLLDEPDAFTRGRMLLGQFHTLAAMARIQRQVALPDEHKLN